MKEWNKSTNVARGVPNGQIRVMAARILFSMLPDSLFGPYQRYSQLCKSIFILTLTILLCGTILQIYRGPGSCIYKPGSRRRSKSLLATCSDILVADFPVPQQAKTEGNNDTIFKKKSLQDLIWPRIFDFHFNNLPLSSYLWS